MGDREKVVLASSQTLSPRFTSCSSILVDDSFKPSTQSSAIAFIVKNNRGNTLIRRAKTTNATSASQTDVLACLEAISLCNPKWFHTYINSNRLPASTSMPE